MKVPGTIASVLARKQNSPLWSVPPTSTVYDAIRLLDAKDIGALPVLEDRKLVGLFSERDYTRKVVLRGKSSKDTRVSEIMSTPVLTAELQETVEGCMRRMTEHRIRHLPIMDNEALVGIVSIGDLVNWVITYQGAAIEGLENYISGRYPG